MAALPDFQFPCGYLRRGVALRVRGEVTQLSIPLRVFADNPPPHRYWVAAFNSLAGI